MRNISDEIGVSVRNAGLCNTYELLEDVNKNGLEHPMPFKICRWFLGSGYEQYFSRVINRSVGEGVKRMIDV